MNKSKLFKDLKAKIKSHKISIYAIEKACSEFGDPISRQTITNVLRKEAGQIGNFCTISGAVEYIINSKN